MAAETLRLFAGGEVRRFGEVAALYRFEEIRTPIFEDTAGFNQKTLEFLERHAD